MTAMSLCRILMSFQTYELFGLFLDIRWNFCAKCVRIKISTRSRIAFIIVKICQLCFVFILSWLVSSATIQFNLKRKRDRERCSLWSQYINKLFIISTIDDIRADYTQWISMFINSIYSLLLLLSITVSPLDCAMRIGLRRYDSDLRFE